MYRLPPRSKHLLTMTIQLLFLRIYFADCWYFPLYSGIKMIQWEFPVKSLQKSAPSFCLFYERIQDLLDSWFSLAGIDVAWLWFCIDNQKWGKVHTHGWLRLKCAPIILISQMMFLKVGLQSMIIRNRVRFWQISSSRKNFMRVYYTGGEMKMMKVHIVMFPAHWLTSKFPLFRKVTLILLSLGVPWLDAYKKSSRPSIWLWVLSKVQIKYFWAQNICCS